jgi:hypothetical protein
MRCCIRAYTAYSGKVNSEPDTERYSFSLGLKQFDFLQFTRFQDNSMCIYFGFHHSVSDGAASCLFAYYWGEMMLGREAPFEPVHDRSLLKVSSLESTLRRLTVAWCAGRERNWRHFQNFIAYRSLLSNSGPVKRRDRIERRASGSAVAHTSCAHFLCGTIWRHPG